MMNYFIALYISHLMGDVFAYSPSLSEAKRSEKPGRKFTGIFLHCLIHSILVLLWFHVLSLDFALSAAIYIFIVHSLIDSSRIFAETILFDQKTVILKRKDAITLLLNRNRLRGDSETRYYRNWLLINFSDQGLHILSIMAFAVLAKS